MPDGAIAVAVHKTPRLVNEYMAIVNDYKDRGYILDSLMNFEVNQKNAGEIYEPYYNAQNQTAKRSGIVRQVANALIL